MNQVIEMRKLIAKTILLSVIIGVWLFVYIELGLLFIVGGLVVVLVSAIITWAIWEVIT